MKITNTPKYWRFAVSVAVCSGHRRGIPALPINHLIFELVSRMPVPSLIHSPYRRLSSSNISRYKRTQSRFPESQRDYILYCCSLIKFRVIYLADCISLFMALLQNVLKRILIVFIYTERIIIFTNTLFDGS